MAFPQPPAIPEEVPRENPGSTVTEPVEPDDATAESPRAVRRWANDLYLVAIMVAVFIVDQVSKQLVRDNIAEGSSVPSEGFFRFTHVSNSGSAFGFFPSQTATLAVASLVGIVILIIFYRRQATPSRWLHASLGLQLGGAA
ncbi:MAG: signal peptidase II, partial [Chloroflexi bacterium]|nr:signal peptidase II [Chloroflexota bacterium]